MEDVALVVSTAGDMISLAQMESCGNDGEEGLALQNCLSRVGILISNFQCHLDSLQNLIDRQRVAFADGGSTSRMVSHVKKATATAIAGRKLHTQLDSLKDQMRECRNNLVCALGVLSNLRQHHQ